MIICFNDKINSFCEFNTNFSYSEQDIQDLMPSCENVHCKCPSCKAKSNFSNHGSYTRNISFITTNKVYDYKVSITRVKCNSCNATHALLPSFVVPYKTYSLESFLYVVSQARSSSAIKVAEALNLSFQLIYYFIATVLSFFNHADSLNREQGLYKNFDRTYFALHCLSICDANFKIMYFNRYQWLFLMTKFQINKPPDLVVDIYIMTNK